MVIDAGGPDASDLPERGCPGERMVAAYLEAEDGELLGEAQAGTMTIDSVSGCVVGAFTFDFAGTDALAGSFAAVRCVF